MKITDIITESIQELEEDSMSLRDWFGRGKHGGAGGGGWDRYNAKGERIGKCGDRKPGEGKPKCLSKGRAASLRASGGKKAIAAAVRKKRREDPNPNREGGAKMVSSRTRKTNEDFTASVPQNADKDKKLSSSRFIIYVGGRPATHYETLRDARMDAEVLKKFGNKKVEIKKEVCHIEDLKEEHHSVVNEIIMHSALADYDKYLGNLSGDPQQLISKAQQARQQLGRNDSDTDLMGILSLLQRSKKPASKWLLAKKKQSRGL